MHKADDPVAARLVLTSLQFRLYRGFRWKASRRRRIESVGASFARLTLPFRPTIIPLPLTAPTHGPASRSRASALRRTRPDWRACGRAGALARRTPDYLLGRCARR